MATILWRSVGQARPFLLIPLPLGSTSYTSLNHGNSEVFRLFTLGSLMSICRLDATDTESPGASLVLHKRSFMVERFATDLKLITPGSGIHPLVTLLNPRSVAQASMVDRFGRHLSTQGSGIHELVKPLHSGFDSSFPQAIVAERFGRYLISPGSDIDALVPLVDHIASIIPSLQQEASRSAMASYSKQHHAIHAGPFVSWSASRRHSTPVHPFPYAHIRSYHTTPPPRSPCDEIEKSGFESIKQFVKDSWNQVRAALRKGSRFHEYTGAMTFILGLLGSFYGLVRVVATLLDSYTEKLLERLRAEIGTERAAIDKLRLEIRSSNVHLKKELLDMHHIIVTDLQRVIVGAEVLKAGIRQDIEYSETQLNEKLGALEKMIHVKTESLERQVIALEKMIHAKNESLERQVIALEKKIHPLTTKKNGFFW